MLRVKSTSRGKLKRAAGLATTALCALVLGALAISSADAATRAEVKRMIVEEAERTVVPPALALAVAKVESDFQYKVESHKGARGVMQIMPATAKGEFGVHADELWDARLNVQLGIDFLAQLYEMYGGKWELALSHYNGGTLKGGPGANARPHGYTRKYVADVTRWWQRYAEQQGVWGTMIADTGTKTDMSPAPVLVASATPMPRPAPSPSQTVVAHDRPSGEADPKLHDGIRIEYHKTIIDDPDPNETGRTKRKADIVVAPGLQARNGVIALAPNAELTDADFGGRLEVERAKEEARIARKRLAQRQAELERVPTMVVPEYGPPVVRYVPRATVRWASDDPWTPHARSGFAQRLAHARRTLDDFADLRRPANRL